MRKVASKCRNENAGPSPRSPNYLRIFLAVIEALAVASCNNTSLLTEVKAEVAQAKNPLTLAVIYDPNGATIGSVPSDGKSYAQGATVTVLSVGTLVRTGFTFAGWNTQANGGGTTYQPSQTFSMGMSSVTLYAIWTPLPKYTLTYDGNGNSSGSVPIDSNSYVQGATVTLLGNTGNLAKSGFTFAGWNTLSDGTGTGYSGGASLSMGAANLTLYAVWTTNPTYTVTYNGNGNTGGSVPVDNNNYLQGATVTVASPGNLARSGGYAFVNWNTLPNGSGISYSSGTTFPMGSTNVTLYAIWTVAYSVAYNANCTPTSGGVPIDNAYYAPGATVTVIGNSGTLTRTGFAFAGWNTQSNGSGITYSQGQTFSMGAGNVTLYAVWKTTYTVTYNANCTPTSGSVPTDPNTYVQGDTVTALGNTGNLVWTGYIFAGWNTQANGSGTTYTGSSTFLMGGSNITLYALWTGLPAISVKTGSTSIPSGGGYDYGLVSVGLTPSAVFTIYNDGVGPLILTGTYPVAISGANASLFLVTIQPSTPIAAGGNASFTVKFSADSAGTKNATATIANNDPLHTSFIFSLTGTASATLAKVPVTGQTTSYAVGDDGNLKKGVAWPNPRFTDNGNGTVTDNLTGLIWIKNSNLMVTRDPTFDADGTANDGSVTWNHAMTYIAKLNTEGYLGYSDWRLPNRKEMRSIFNFGQSNAAAWLNGNGFTNVQAAYWTSTTVATNSAAAYYVYMLNCSTCALAKTDTYDWHVWAVRGSGPGTIGLPKSGQTASYMAGDDGALQIGNAWPSPRFKDNSDGTITDNLTGLMWEKDPGTDTSFFWADALAHVASLTTGGYSDWRLANADEFESLISLGANSTSYLLSQGFTTVPYSVWTSTSANGDPNDGAIWYNGDYTSETWKTYQTCGAWAVRAGQ